MALAYLQKWQPSTSKEELSNIDKPVLIICGDKDTDNGNAQELVKLIPKAEFAQVPGDHGGAMRTEEFANNVLQFFK